MLIFLLINSVPYIKGITKDETTEITAFGEVTKESILVNKIINFNSFLYKGYYYDDCDDVIEIGYDGRIIAASVSGLTIGATYLLKDGKFKLEYGYGWWGWSVSIDFIELFKWLFGGE